MAARRLYAGPDRGHARTVNDNGDDSKIVRLHPARKTPEELDAHVRAILRHWAERDDYLYDGIVLACVTDRGSVTSEYHVGKHGVFASMGSVTLLQHRLTTEMLEPDPERLE